MPLDERVALAGGMLQTSDVEDDDALMRVIDKSGAVQCAGGERDRRPSHSQERGQDILRHGELITPDPIPNLEKSSGAPFLNRVQRIAGD
jgi:hypothetical protein